MLLDTQVQFNGAPGWRVESAAAPFLRGSHQAVRWQGSHGAVTVTARLAVSLSASARGSAFVPLASPLCWLLVVMWEEPLKGHSDENVRIQAGGKAQQRAHRKRLSPPFTFTLETKKYYSVDINKQPRSQMGPYNSHRIHQGGEARSRAWLKKTSRFCNTLKS